MDHFAALRPEIARRYERAHATADGAPVAALVYRLDQQVEHANRRQVGVRASPKVTSNLTEIVTAMMKPISNDACRAHAMASALRALGRGAR